MLLADLINKVRRKLNDWYGGDAGSQQFTDEYYQDASDYAIGRLNIDLETAYAVATIPTTLEHVLVWLTTIEMCSVFKSAISTSTTNGSLRRLEVQGLETEFHPSSVMNAEDWDTICEDLESRYQDFLDNEAPPEDVDDLPLVVSVTANRSHLRDGRALRHRELDRGVDAPDITLALSSEGVVITWSVVYNVQFAYYKIQRKLPAGDWFIDEDVEDVATIYDNQVYRYVDDEDLDPGTYVYRMVVINRNAIEKYSTEAAVVVS